MLEELSIRDFALIDSLTVEFDNGLNILTGETGAGKSIIVGALEFLLGGKADVESIRSGRDETIVSAIIRLDPIERDALSWLSLHEIGLDEDRVMLRRSLKRNGRSVAYIQSMPISRTDLLEFTACLFEIHGQHEHQALMKAESHRRYLDRFAGIEDEVDKFAGAFQSLSEKKKALQATIDQEKERAQRIELLSFAIDEIDEAKLEIGESERLEIEARKFSSYEKLASYIIGSCANLVEEESSALALIRKSKTQLEAASQLDNELEPLAKRMADLYYEAEDIAEQIRSYRDGLQYDPERLEAIETRIAAIFRLKKKYGHDEEAILSFRKSAVNELDDLRSRDARRSELSIAISVEEKSLAQKAKILSEKRSKAATVLGDEITHILASLGMQKSRFLVSVKPKGDGVTGRVCGLWGTDDVQFFISPNQGEDMRELTKIASGGELSRVMLAIKTVLSDADAVGTLIFDEIDTGIGGEVALSVGRHLKSLGKTKQIFCITHLASIAVRADNHVKVLKVALSDRTTTTISKVGPDDRRFEIARMLAGDAGGEAALAHADELLAKYGGEG